jgi:hypothetical protein
MAKNNLEAFDLDNECGNNEINAIFVKHKTELKK